jgi:pilin isopeptide linkage protein
MPEGSAGNRKTVQITGAGRIEFGPITFTRAGTFVYTVIEQNTAADGWVYDAATYTITLVVQERDNALFVVSQTIIRDDANVDNVVFENKYEPDIPDDRIQIIGTKTWNHGDNPVATRPDSILVYVKAGGQIVAQRIVTASDQWTYVFTNLPKYDADGRLITYVVSEQKIPGYQTKVNGYDLINTYDPTDPDKPTIPGGPGTGTAKTGDSLNLWPWIVLMIISSILLMVGMHADDWRCYMLEKYDEQE